MNFRVAIDGAMICVFLFSAGLGWSKLEAVGQAVNSLQLGMALQPASAERLARVEEKLDRLIRDVDRLQGDR